MKIVFLDAATWNYDIDTAYQRPLGGSQSALCYLSESLVKRGHSVWLFNSTAEPGCRRGVECRRLSQTTAAMMHELDADACIVLNTVLSSAELRRFMGPRSRLALWTQHASDEELMSRMSDPTLLEFYDAFIFVSEWQRASFVSRFGIEPRRTVVLRNAISPWFANLFEDGRSILQAKARPPVLAYTSAPFRGLDLLIAMFPEIRQAVPGVRLKVFSSLGVYHVPREQDEREFGPLYEACRRTEGVEYIGSVPQAQLAGEMRQVTALAYPNTFAETSCIAMMEAMASGCWVLTSDLGALPETAAGFARLFSLGGGVENYCQQFARTLVQFLQHVTSNPSWPDLENHLQRQVQFVNQNYTWDRRAVEWERWLGSRG